MICRKNEVVPVECIVRGYLTGSGYKDYLRTGKVCGISLPEGMINAPIFTPSTKVDQGHDENISFKNAVEHVGQDLLENIRDISIGI